MAVVNILVKESTGLDGVVDKLFAVSEDWNSTNRILGDFTFLRENVQIIEESYNRMIGIVSVINFSLLREEALYLEASRFDYVYFNKIIW